MKRILSVIFVILTISAMVFSEEMPKETNYEKSIENLTININI